MTLGAPPAQGKGTIGKLLYDDTLYQELEGLVADVRRHPWKLFWKGEDKRENRKKK